MKYKRTLSRLKLKMDMKFLYMNKFKEPVFTMASAKAIDVSANEIMNSLYAKCLKPDLTAAESFTYAKADDITDPASEYSKILEPVSKAVDALKDAAEKT